MLTFLEFLNEAKKKDPAATYKYVHRYDYETADGKIRTGRGWERRIKKGKDDKWGKGRDEGEPDYDKAVEDNFVSDWTKTR